MGSVPLHRHVAVLCWYRRWATIYARTCWHCRSSASWTNCGCRKDLTSRWWRFAVNRPASNEVTVKYFRPFCQRSRDLRRLPLTARPSQLTRLIVSAYNSSVFLQKTKGAFLTVWRHSPQVWKTHQSVSCWWWCAWYWNFTYVASGWTSTVNMLFNSEVHRQTHQTDCCTILFGNNNNNNNDKCMCDRACGAGHGVGDVA